MSEIALIKAGEPVFRVVIAETTIPSQILPAELTFPTHARILFRGDSLRIDVQILGRDEEFWNSSEDDGEYRSFDLGKDDLLRFITEARWPAGSRYVHSCAILEIRDPYEVDAAFQILFASLDANNPDYWMKFLAKKLTEDFRLPTERKCRDEDDEIGF